MRYNTKRKNALNGENYSSNTKTGSSSLSRFVVITAGFIIPQYVFAEVCHVAATMCDVKKAISTALSTFSPVPPQPALASVNLAVQTISNLVPATTGFGPLTYNYNIVNTIMGSVTGASADVVVSCTPNPTFKIYNGTTQHLSAATTTTFDTTTPGTTCPFGTASCGSPAAITFTLLASGAVHAPVTDTNYDATTFTSLNTGWYAYATGYYDCSYTDPNIAGTTVHLIVPFGGGAS